MLHYVFQAVHKNDEVFWPMLRTFLDEHRGQEVCTADFIAAAEHAFGGSLAWFWDQWLFGTEIPEVRWGHTLEQTGERWVLTVQAKREDGDQRLILPIHIHLRDGTVASRPLLVEGGQGKLQLAFPQRPREVTANDDWQLLARVRAD